MLSYPYVAAAPESVRRTAALLHASAYLGLLGGVLFLVGPLVVWLLKRDEHPALDAAGKEAVNFHLTMLLAGLVAVPLCFVLIGIPLAFALFVLSVVCPLVAAVRTANGEDYRYPLTIRFLR